MLFFADGVGIFVRGQSRCVPLEWAGRTRRPSARYRGAQSIRAESHAAGPAITPIGVG